MNYDSWKTESPPRCDDAPKNFDRWLYTVEEILLEEGVHTKDKEDYSYLYDKFRDGYSPERIAALLVYERTQP